jgi:DNA-directed RNA polymerase specialized sigma24 family protein
MGEQVLEAQAWLGFGVDTEWWAYISRCAREFADRSDEREDLVCEAVEALLGYRRPIRHPRGFVRALVRNLAINRRCAGAQSRELTNSDAALELGDSERRVLELPAVIVIRETLELLTRSLTRSESQCYELLKAGHDRKDLPRLLGISRQAVSKLLRGIRRKYEALEAED